MELDVFHTQTTEWKIGVTFCLPLVMISEEESKLLADITPNVFIAVISRKLRKKIVLFVAIKLNKHTHTHAHTNTYTPVQTPTYPLIYTHANKHAIHAR